MKTEQRLLACAALLALVCALGACKDDETSQDRTPVAEADAPAPPVDAVPAPGDDPRPAPASPDLAFYPMPETLPGEELVAGRVSVRPQVQVPERGGECPLDVRSDGNRTMIMALSKTVNCCTDSIRASVEREGDVVHVRLYEYLPDVCECYNQRSVRLVLEPFDARGLEVRVYGNAEPEACGVAVVPDGE